MEAIKLVKMHFTKFVDYKKYGLVDQSQEYNNHVSGKMVKWCGYLDVQIRLA